MASDNHRTGRMDMVVRVPATMSDVRETEARLKRLISETQERLARLEILISAVHLGSTCHPEWVQPGKGPAAQARRAAIVEAVIHMAGDEGMTLEGLAAYLHVPPELRDVVSQDCAYLVENDRIKRINRNTRWRIQNART